MVRRGRVRAPSLRTLPPCRRGQNSNRTASCMLRGSETAPFQRPKSALARSVLKAELPLSLPAALKMCQFHRLKNSSRNWTLVPPASPRVLDERQILAVIAEAAHCLLDAVAAPVVEVERVD